MKIAVDARELTGRPTGVGRYLSELIAQWADSADARRHEWWFYSASAPSVPKAFEGSIRLVSGGGGGTRWEQWNLPRALAADRPDVLFAPGYTAPFTASCPTIVTIHDVSFAAHPEWFSRREGARRRTLTAWSARRARLVLTDSVFSRSEIARYLGIPTGKVRVVLLGMTPPPPDKGSGVDAAAATVLHEPPIVLFVGSIFQRRHVDRLIHAFVTSVATQVPESRLEIVGENRSYPPIDFDATLRSCPPQIASRVSLCSYVDESRLADLYARARVFAFPSEYEGFGLTPLEALARGVPPVVLDTPIAREVYGKAACYVPADLTDTTPLAQAIVDLLQSPARRAEILSHRPAILARYDWRRAATETLHAIEEAGGA
jgi:glycosyltransferase involved in cell wall biosynthesis